MIRKALQFSLALLATGALAIGQDKPEEDPFTEGDADAMAELGVLSYGPLTWADNKRTTDIDKVLGPGRVRWFETAHFKFGMLLDGCGAPKDPKARRIVKDELKLLNKRCRKIPSSSSKLSPWLRAHLYALRAEQLYDEIAKLTGREAVEGHMGRKEKFLVVMFTKRSDLARYTQTFCGREFSSSQRHQHMAHLSLVMSAEGDDGPYDCETSYAQFRFFMAQLLLDGAGGVPPWLGYGLGHWYERQVPCRMINCGIRANESVDPATQYDWPRKMEKRCKHEELCLPFVQLCNDVDLGYYGHVQAWSRVDYLIDQGQDRFQSFVQAIVGRPTRQRQIQALGEVYEIEPAEFDEAWRKWALKHY